MEKIFNVSDEKKSRSSGIELLRIIAILLVVTCHVVATLGSDNSQFVGYNDYFVNIALPSHNLQYFVLGMLSYSGILGNGIFFISSAWFLLDKNTTNTKKIFRMLCEVWVISVLWLLGTLLFTDIKLTKDFIKLSLLPSLYSNNWYITLYMVFSFIFPFLNIIINNIDKQKHLIISCVLFVLYICMPFVRWFPYANELVLWIAIYFVIGYFKKYHIDKCDNRHLNNKILVVNVLVQFLLILGVNFLSLSKIDFYQPLTKWLNNYNVFIYIIAFSLVNIFRQKTFINLKINCIASCSMLVYLLHENILCRTYFRPLIWQFIYNNLGYDLVLLWAILYVLLLFLLSLGIALLYKLTLQKLLYKIVDKIYGLLKKIGSFIFQKINYILNKE